MRVLLTRAVEDAARTKLALEDLGHLVLVSPVITIERTGAPWPAGTVDGALATSSQAFRAMPPDWGPSPAARRLMPLWLVGTRTEEAARSHGFLGPATVARNAIALALEMTKRRGPSRIVYLAGEDRKPDIETALHVTEQQVEVAVVYRARAVDRIEPPVADRLGAGTIDIALHFSRRSADILVGLVRGSGVPPPRRNLCLSPDVAAPLVGAGWSTEVAEEATEACLIAMTAGPGST